jgi:DNA helicase II / ATP-dependent DNA helicase PcrA
LQYWFDDLWKFIMHLLNEQQKEAVNILKGPVLVIAGAGSGKTRVVTFRIANLLESGVHPSQILGLTFTNKAAGEMKERVHSLTQSNVLICTFHSLGARILRESIDALSYQRNFIIYDEDDVEKLLKVCLNELQITDKKQEPKAFRQLISRAKNAMQQHEDLNEKELVSSLEKSFPAVYKLYQEKLHFYNALDFDDLLFLTVRLFNEHPEILQIYQDRWPYLLIDEYQDTNVAQYTLVRRLVEKSQNIFAVGDPDQSIYSWRGANVKNILNFENEFHQARVIRLERNYRTHMNILAGANALIGHNRNRYEKNLWSDLPSGPKIQYFSADTERGEADFIAEKIRRLHEEQRVPLSQIVVFYRTNFQSRAFEDTFLAKGIPYIIVGGISFYQRKEIKDLLAFLRMVHSGSDFLAFMRTINLPKRGIGEATIEKIRIAAHQENLTIFAYLVAYVKNEHLAHRIKLSEKQKEEIKNYVSLIETLKKVSQETSLKELVKTAIEESGYLKFLSDDPESFDDRKLNLDALITKALEWESTVDEPSLAGFLEELSLKSSLDDVDDTNERVNFMTIHNGKGLEFTAAFLAGMEEDLFPHANSRESPEAVEEERRLCYVGMTRAKHYLYLTESRFRYLWGVSRNQRPSRFIKEIPLEYIEKIKPSFYNEKPISRPAPTRQPTYQEQTHIEEIEDTFSDEEFTVEEVVFHKQFGVGVIKQISSSSVGMTYKILFSNDQRERTLVAKYAHLKRL